MQKSIIFIVIYLCLDHFTSFGQSDNYYNLIQSIKTISPKTKNEFLKISPECIANIDSKLNYANIYLIVELQNLSLSDSSQYYNDKRKELRLIENKNLLDHKDSALWLNEMEKMLLLVSVLRPSKSDTLFHKLIKIWYEIKEPVALQNADESFINYKIWLYELLNNRFKIETDYFANTIELYQYNKAILYCQSRFKSITDDRDKIKKFTDLLKFAHKDSLVKDFYGYRLFTLMGEASNNKSDSLFNYMDSLFVKHWDMEPKNKFLDKNIYIFYYNRGVYFMNKIEEDKYVNFDFLLNEAEKYFEKAKFYSERIDEYNKK